MMTALTLRLDDSLARDLDRACQEHGYNKTGLIKKLIRDFLGGHSAEKASQIKSTKDIRSIVGIINLGGDSVKDADEYYK